MTPAATSGPAQAPRPASSTPATRRKPPCRRAASAVKSGSSGLTTSVDAATVAPSLLVRPGLLRGHWPTLLDPRRLASQIAKVVQLRATHDTTPGDLDLVDARRVIHKRSLDADAVAGDPANRERPSHRLRAVG